MEAEATLSGARRIFFRGASAIFHHFGGRGEEPILKNFKMKSYGTVALLHTLLVDLFLFSNTFSPNIGLISTTFHNFMDLIYVVGRW